MGIDMNRFVFVCLFFGTAIPELRLRFTDDYLVEPLTYRKPTTRLPRIHRYILEPSVVNTMFANRTPYSFALGGPRIGVTVLFGRQLNKNICLVEGGTCVAAQTDCGGWLELHDLGCSSMFCCKPAPVTSFPPPDYPGDHSCGKITRVSDPSRHMLRIVDGEQSLEGQWPWQVALLDSAGNQFCGGTLVSPEFVVTAAHCFISHTGDEVEVLLGEHHLVFQTGNEQRSRVAKLVKHTGFRLEDHRDDIAFLQLSTPVNVSGHYIRTVCLPDSDSVWQTGDQCYASGWGYTRGSSDSRHLQHVSIDLVPEPLCKSAWKTEANITNNQLCAGSGTSGTCQGDSGGPLVCVRNGVYFLVGVTSYGHFTCQQDGYPDVFTRVTSYVDWLSSYMLLLKTIS